MELGLFHHRFMAIAERKSAYGHRSVNIRERLDFSCALSDRRGALYNAPHIPVHLGSMGEVVADQASQVQAGARPALQSGETCSATTRSMAAPICPI